MTKTLLLLVSTSMSAFGQFGVCDEDVDYALEVTFSDSATGGPVIADITASASDGSFVEARSYTAAQAEFNREMLFGRERPGTYEVVVNATGYQLWVRDGVRVEKGSCGVQPVQLAARLQR